MQKLRVQKKEATRLEQLKNTVRKLYREHSGNVNQRDVDIIEDFEANPKVFLDYDPHLALDLKHLYDKR